MIYIISSKFNNVITENLKNSAVKILEQKKEKYKIINVPGAVEIPIIAQKMSRKKETSVIIALGCVIKGDTDHYEFVLRSCIDGLNRVSLDESVPIIQGILACRNFSDAWDRRMLGEDFALTALEIKKLF